MTSTRVKMDPENQGRGGFLNIHGSTTAAIQSLCFLVALGITLCITHWMTLRSQKIYIPESSVESLLTLYMVGALIIMYLLWRSKCSSDPVINHNDPSELDNGSSTQSREERARWLATRWFQIKLRQVLPLIGVAIFFTLGSFQDILRIIAKLSCFDTYVRCGALFIWKYVANLMYHISRLLFMGFEMVFCYAFYNRKTFKGSHTLWRLVIIVSATVMVWFDCTLYDSDGLFNDDETIRTRNECAIPHEQILPADRLCIMEVTELYNSTLSWGKFFYPLNIEFLLLVMEMVLHFLIVTIAATHIAPSTKPNITVAEPALLSSGYDSLEGGGESSSSVSGNNQSPVETSASTVEASDTYIEPIRGNIQIPSSSEASSSETQLLLGQTSNSLKNTTTSPSSNYGPLLFFSGLMLNVVFVALGILTYQTSMKETWLLIYEIFRMLYWLPGIVACFVGFHVTKSFQCHNSQHYKGLEIMVILSAAGIALYCCFSLESIIPCLLHTFPIDNQTVGRFGNPTDHGAGRCTSTHSWLLLVDTLFNLAQVYLQSNFLSHAFHLKPGLVEVNMTTRSIQGQRNSGPGISRPPSPAQRQANSTLLPHNMVTIEQFRRKRRIFRNVVTYLLLSNFTLWGIHSFIEMKNPSIEPIQVYYYTLHRWEYIVHLTMPLCLFYRFNSFILFTEIYLDH